MWSSKVFCLVRTSTISVVSLYGICSLLSELCSSIIPFGIVLVLLLTALGYYLHLPAPSKGQVEAIIGKELHLEENGKGLRTVAHRGAGLDAPENTLAAFQMCQDKGCGAIEFDVTLTKDGVPIVFHDKTLERMTDDNILVNKTAWKDLQNLDLSKKHSFKERFTKTNIPTLEETVNQLLVSGQKMFIDIKDNNSKMVPVILDLFKRHPELYSNAIVTSFYPNLIYLIRKSDLKIVCSMAWRPHAFTNESYKYPDGPGLPRGKSWWEHFALTTCDVLHQWALPKITTYLLGISVILLHKDAISPQRILFWRNRGLRVMAWTVNSPIEKQFFSRNMKITYLTDTLTGESTTHTS